MEGGGLDIDGRDKPLMVPGKRKGWWIQFACRLDNQMVMGACLMALRPQAVSRRFLCLQEWLLNIEKILKGSYLSFRKIVTNPWFSLKFLNSAHQSYSIYKLGI